MGRPRIGRLPDPGILLWANNQPAIARRNGALVVGYLGFRAGVFPIAALIMLESASELAAEGANTAIMPNDISG